MKSIVLQQPGQFQRAETAEPSTLQPDEALVRVRRIGICGTDLHAFRGRQPFFSYPRILGHELGVEVVEVGQDVQGLPAGERCAVEPYLYCGACVACRRGKPNCCTHLQVLGVHADGGMREYFVLPAAKLHPSRSLSLDQLALVETLGIGAHAVQRARLEAGENVLVIGAGPIGLSVIQFAGAAGAKVCVLDMNEERLSFARRHFNVEHCLRPGEKIVEELEGVLSDLPTVVFDATGNPNSMMQAFNLVAHGGKLVFVGLFQGDVTFNDPNFHRREMTLLSSRNSTTADFKRIIAQMEAGKLDTAPWITHRAPFDNLIEEFSSWLLPESGVVKAMVQLD